MGLLIVPGSVGEARSMVRNMVKENGGFRRLIRENNETFRSLPPASLFPVSAPKAGIAEAEKLASVLKIETVKRGSGIEIAKEQSSNDLWARLMEVDPSLKPYYWDNDKIGMKAGRNLKEAVGMTFIQAARAAEVLSKLTGENWFIPEEDQLLEAKPEIAVGKNKHGSLFEWTSSDWEEGKPWKVFINLLSGVRNNDNYPPVNCYINLGVRFAKRT